MYLTGRYEKVRCLSAQGLSPAYILDKKWSALKPAGGSEWWQSPTGIWIPIPSGGIGFSGLQQPVVVLGNPEPNTSGAQAVSALDSAYVPGTSGDAVGAKFALHSAKTLNEVYYYIVSYQGTAANVNDIDVEIRSDGGSQTLPNTGAALATVTHNPASATGWQRVTGYTLSLSAATAYWLSIGDPDGNATDFVRILQLHSNVLHTLPTNWVAFMSASTTNGWVGDTLSRNAAAGVLLFSDGTVFGVPFSAFASSTSNALQRGLSLSGLTAQLKIFGIVISATANAALAGIRVWEGASGPSGTPFAQSGVTLRNNVGSVEGVLLSAPATLAASTAYRIVTNYNSATTAPGKMNIGTGSDATVRKAMLGGGTWYWTEEVAGPAWSDDIDAWPTLGILIEDQVAGGGGGGGLLGGSLLNRGFN